jgi:hypothetical protein
MAWRKCSTCKSWIGYGSRYLKCNVSTCNRKRTGMVFCSEPCWDAHVPIMNHRDAWTEKAQAPMEAEEKESMRRENPRENQPQRRLVRNAPVQKSEAIAPRSDAPQEVLIVASRLKIYVKARSGMNTSDGVLGPLSDIVRKAIDEAITNAEDAERKTGLERDVNRA